MSPLCFILFPMKFLIFIPLIAVASGRTHIVDNQVISEPRIECEPDQITVSMQTKLPFSGNLYVRGQFSVDECRAAFYNSAETTPYISVPIGQCGMIKSTQENGLNYSTVIVVSFHPNFETRQDEAYAVNCFYNTKPISVSSNLDVGNPPAQPAEPLSQTRENKCDYSIREESVEGPITRYVDIGKAIVHRWHCDDPNEGILVRSCSATTENGVVSTEVIDDRGCPTSGFFDQLTYDQSMTLAFVRVEAFKFPDINTIRFECKISFCNKLHRECIGVTPPNCPKVPREDFNPSSTVNIDADPTVVIGTFNEPFHPRHPRNRVREGYETTTSTPRNPFALPQRSPQYAEVLRTIQQPAISPISAFGLKNNTDNVLVYNREDKRTAVIKQAFNPVTNERNGRKRRDEDHVLKVKAETLYVADTLDPSIHGKPITMNSANSYACFNKQNTAILLASIAFLIALTLAMLAYIAFDIVFSRHRRAKIPISDRPSIRHVNFTAASSIPPYYGK